MEYFLLLHSVWRSPLESCILPHVLKEAYSSGLLALILPCQERSVPPPPFRKDLAVVPYRGHKTQADYSLCMIPPQKKKQKKKRERRCLWIVRLDKTDKSLVYESCVDFADSGLIFDDGEGSDRHHLRPQSWSDAVSAVRTGKRKWSNIGPRTLSIARQLKGNRREEEIRPAISWHKQLQGSAFLQVVCFLWKNGLREIPEANSLGV